jgi:hypothetical protein
LVSDCYTDYDYLTTRKIGKFLLFGMQIANSF